MSIQLSEHFDYKKLLRLTFPSIIMLIVTSLYSIVDGFFVSNFIGKSPFAAVNFIMPFLMVIGSLGFMMGTGGGALIAKEMGEGKGEKANQTFSMIVYVSFILSIVLTVLGIAFIRPVAMFLGAKGELLENSVRYGRVFLLGTPAYVLQYEFQCLFATANKPRLGLVITIMAGLANVVFDALLVAVFPLGLEGAAIASVLGQLIGGILPVIYFARENTSLLRLGKFVFHRRDMLRVCLNGSSEMLSNISTSIVGMVYNVQLLKFIGENGVSAYGVLMYVSMIFTGVFIGFSVGSAPVISYHYGAGNTRELKGLKKRCLVVIGFFAGVMFALSMLMSKFVASVFVGYDAELFALTIRAFRIYALSFLFCGFAIFTSSFFTALNNGPVSAAVSFLRTFVFQVLSVLLLPLLIGSDGIWFSIVLADALSLFASFIFLRLMKKKYKY